MNEQSAHPSWNDIVEMIQHWAWTPGNGYLGSSYGGKTQLETWIGNPPDHARLANVIAKLQEDLPTLEGREINIWWRDQGISDRAFTITVANKSAEITLP